MTRALISKGRHPGAQLLILLILTLGAALPGCKARDGISEHQQEEKKREDAIAALREQGGTVTQKSYPPHGNGYVIDLKGAQLTDQTFQNLKDLQRIAELDLSKSSLVDDQMDQLNAVAYVLLKLDLSNTKVTDAGLEKLTNLRLCIDLNLVGTQVTPAEVERLKKQHPPRSIGQTKMPAMKVRLQ